MIYLTHMVQFIWLILHFRLTFPMLSPQFELAQNRKFTAETICLHRGFHHFECRILFYRNVILSKSVHFKSSIYFPAREFLDPASIKHCYHSSFYFYIVAQLVVCIYDNKASLVCAMLSLL